MPTLRDQTKKALGATEPDDAEAKKTLDAVADAPPPPQRRILTPLVYCIVAAALVFVVFLRKGPHTETGPSELARAKGVHLYLKAAGEPDSQAMRFDLDPIGARTP